MGGVTGKICPPKKKSSVDELLDNTEGEYTRDKSETVRAILIASDYKQTDTPLDCVKFNGVQMQQLMQRCGIDDVTVLFQNDITKSKITEAMNDVASRCEADDTLFIYFLGHGDYQDDKDGDEEDGQDEVLCLVGDDPSQWDYMSDDEWSDLITGAIPPDTRIVLVTDCCHSGSMADMDKAEWNGREAVNLVGCADEQTGMDMGKGSFFTNSLIKAVDEFQAEGNSEYNVAELYNKTLEVFERDCRPILEPLGLNQTLGIESPGTFDPANMQWPLAPQ